MRMATDKMGDDYKQQQGYERTASLHYKQTTNTNKDAGKSATNTQTQRQTSDNTDRETVTQITTNKRK